MFNFEGALLRSRRFYALPTLEDTTEDFLTGELDGYVLRRGEYWTSYRLIGSDISPQGWKIHISSSPTDLDEVVTQTLAVIDEYRLHFKIVNTRDSYFLANSKNANRTSAGKLITIYPDKASFEKVVIALASRLKPFDGPEILTDLPGPVPCIHFRYGAFVPMVNADGEYCLLNDDGDLVPDRREVLDPVQSPETDLKIVHEAVARLQSGRTLDVSNVTLVKQSNAGGIYRCTFDGKKAFLKLGRKFAGFDQDLNDGAFRVKNEHTQLSRLISSGATPRVLALTELATDVALITEDLECLDLHQFKKAKFPLYARNGDDWVPYLREVLKVATRLEKRIKLLHYSEVYHRDLHGRNVLTDGEEVYFVDFEEATNSSDDVPGSSKAQGYANFNVNDAEESDWFAFRQIIQELTFGNTRVNQFNEAGWDRRWDDPYESMLNDHRVSTLLKQLRKLAAVDGRLRNPLLDPSFSDSKKPTITARTMRQKISHDAELCIRETGSISVSPDRLENGAGYCLEFAYLKTALQADWDLARVVPNFLQHSQSSYGVGLPDIIDRLEEQYQSIEAPAASISRSEVLQLLLIARFSSQVCAYQGVVRKWILRIAKQARSLHFEKPLHENSNRPNDQRTGLLYGPLGLAWILSLWLEEMHESDVALAKEAITYLVEQELTNYDSNSEGALFAVQGNRLLPYLSTGSAGFGLLLPMIKKTLGGDWLRPEAERLLNAVDTEFSICSGLANGMMGLIVGTAGISSYLDRPYSVPALYRRVRRLLPMDSAGDLFLDDSSLRYVFDVSEGAGGFILLPGLLRIVSMEALDDFEL
ncbi:MULTISPECIES: hypothetical protein [Corynebacterium]|uniref:class III lanthionine synthetase LanKC N-terminal domain-containing protein n=1 Tax=Corynebacterium TaxID=1716 RepID=UPI0006665E8E|nr:MULTISPECIES: hypothetical protein [Corynebacterium]OFQ56874.1 hypothetical protein HMPREF2932_08805 [Corynebacterium sp. HMSC074H12]